MSMRDRNKLSLQSTLLGANEFDIRVILALTGAQQNYLPARGKRGFRERLYSFA